MKSSKQQPGLSERRPGPPSNPNAGALKEFKEKHKGYKPYYDISIAIEHASHALNVLLSGIYIQEAFKEIVQRYKEDIALVATHTSGTRTLIYVHPSLVYAVAERAIEIQNRKSESSGERPHHLRQSISADNKKALLEKIKSKYGSPKK